MTAKATVLIVDDKRANMLALAAVLEPDYALQFAESGEQAIAAVKAHAVDVILMDVQMPGMDGFQAAARIKALDEGRDIPIIFVTAVYHEDPFVRQGYAAGGVDYFAKPFDPEILKMKVRLYAAFKLREKLLRERELHVQEAEEMLRVGKKLAAVLESLPVGVMIADVDGRVCQITDLASTILRCDADPAQDSYARMLGWWDGAGRMIKNHDGPLARTLQRGETSQGEPVEIECLDGGRKTILVSASPLRGLAGHLAGAVILLQDMTEPKKIGAALQERVTRLLSAGLELEESATQ